jgi:hypothetical protein
MMSGTGSFSSVRLIQIMRKRSFQNFLDLITLYYMYIYIYRSCMCPLKKKQARDKYIYICIINPNKNKISKHGTCLFLLGVLEQWVKLIQDLNHPQIFKKTTCERGCSSCYTLVVLTILKNISQLGRIIPYIMENKKCSKPSTSIYCHSNY